MKSMKAGSSSSAGDTAMTTLDSRIWRNLPSSLMDRILAILPPDEFLRLRSVCKRWYSLLFSGAFLEAALRLSPALPWLAFFYDGDNWMMVLDPRSGRWLRLPLSPFPIPPGYSAAASDAGILCFVSCAPGAKSVLLCNPLSRLTARMPAAGRGRLRPAVGVSAGPSSLTVVLAGDDLISPFAVKNLTAESFAADGSTGEYAPWTRVSQLPRLCCPEPPRLVFSDGAFYCLSRSPFAVLSYHVTVNRWCKIQAPMRRFLRSPSLALRGAHLLLVAGVEKPRLAAPRTLRVWALQPCGRAWAELLRMPPEIHRQFAEAEAGRGFECAAHADVLAITIKGGATDILLFDFAAGEWRWAPTPPFAVSQQGRELRGFAYEPRLATPALALIDSSSSSST